MTDADRKSFGETLAALAFTFERKLDKATIGMYWLALRDLPIAAFHHAVERAVRELRFFPVPADLRRMSGAITTAEHAARAFEAVKACVARFGAWQSVDLGPLVNATVRNLGGWVRICSLDSDEFDKWLRRDFERVYSMFADSGVTSEQARHLPGIHEGDAKGGQGLPPTVSVHRIAGPEPKMVQSVTVQLFALRASEGHA